MSYDPKEYAKKWREKNREHINAYHKEWCKKNQDHVRKYRKRYQSKYQKEYARKWREKNRERINEYHKEWNRRNPDKLREYKEKNPGYYKEWAAKNPDKVKAIQKRANIKRRNKRRYEYFLDGFIKRDIAEECGADTRLLFGISGFVLITEAIERGADEEKIAEYFEFLKSEATSGGNKDD